MPLVTKLLAIYNRSGLPGAYRLTNYLAQRFKSLQCVSIQTESGLLYADLRISSSHGLLANPKSLSGEDKLMRKVVKKGDTVFDIGAHLGLYTLLLSELVGQTGKVFAFEPNPELLPTLRKTVNSTQNIDLINVALSDSKGETTIFIPEDASMASLRNWTCGIAGRVHQVECKMRKIDDLVEEGKIYLPQFIKCDVEGGELSVFKGGIKTINRIDAPIILFEVNAKAAREFRIGTVSYFDFLESLEHPEYSFFEVFNKGVKVLSSKEIEYKNIIAVPKAKLYLIK
jgi:FkbM family methyltransferase